MTFSTLKSTVAILALTAGAAIAQSESVTDEEMTPNTELSQAESHAEDAAESAENTLENTGEAIGDAANATAEGAENAAEATGEAIDDAAEATADTAGNAMDATEEMANDAAEATENAADSAATEMSEETEEMNNEVATDGTTATPDAQAGDEINPTLASMTVGDLLGKDVIEANGETIGEIDYIVVDGGKLSAVIGIGGFLGLGEYTVAIPVSELEPSAEDENALKLTRWTESELESQPEFDESGVESLPEDMSIAMAS